MEFIQGIAEFLLQALILLGVFLLACAGVISMSNRRKESEDGFIEVQRLNDRYEAHQESILAITESDVAAKHRLKDKKKTKKQEKQNEKKALKQKTHSLDRRAKIFVLDFEGDIQASQVSQLREEVSAILMTITEDDEVLLRLDSGGGVVHGYGLAASQLARLRENGVKLTVSVDKVAASGGYMMACVADQIIAAPFAIIGSIGVVAQLPNFNRLLKKNDIDFEMHTAGEFKRTLTVFGENTDKAREKFQADIEDVHGLFKEFVARNRPTLDVEAVSTGEYWFGEQALEKNLADQLCTSDDFLQTQLEHKDLIGVRYRNRRNWQERLGLAAELLVERGVGRFLKTQRDKQFV